MNRLNVKKNELVQRTEVLSHCSFLDDSDIQGLRVEAQAGQGKTVLIRQFQELSSRDFLWITCTDDDYDPCYFFQKVISACAEKFPKIFSDHNLMPLKMQLNANDFKVIAPDLIADLISKAGIKVTFVFDDLHYIQVADESKALVKRFTALVNGFAKFIFISRYMITYRDEPLLSTAETILIDKDMLAFSREEIALLSYVKFGVAADIKRINMLLEATEGWVTGLILLGCTGQDHNLKGYLQDHDLQKYFDILITSSLPQGGQKVLCLLALLPNITSKVLNSCFSCANIEWLKVMAGKNLFVSIVHEDGKDIFRLHHLLQSYLFQKASSSFSENEIMAFMQKIGSIYAESGDIISALSCYSKVRAWAEFELAMREYGYTLLFQNYSQVVVRLLAEITENELKFMPWSCFALGVGKMESFSSECLSLLNLSKNLFSQCEDMLGELLATSHLIIYHVFVSGNFAKKVGMADRAGYVLEKIHSQLTDHILCFCCEAVAMGFNFFQSNTKQVEYFSSLPVRTRHLFADKFLFYGLSAIALDGFNGALNNGLQKLSSFLPIVKKSWVSPTNVFSLLVFQLNYLIMKGDFLNYNDLKQDMLKNWSHPLNESYVGLFLFIWDVDIMISKGNYVEAFEIIRKYKDDPRANCHIRSQFLHYEVLTLAHLGKLDKTTSCINEALALRARSGGPYFLDLTHALIGASFSISGMELEADRIFMRLEKRSKKGLSSYLAPIIFSYRAAMRINAKQYDLARDDVRLMLQYMKKGRNLHFFGCSPMIMSKVLSFAVQNEIEVDYARLLATEQMGVAIPSRERIVPLLYVNVVGEFKLKNSNYQIKSRDLSPMQRKFLTYLAIAPKLNRDIDSVKRFLWPESDVTDSKVTFDTMLSRLRKKFRDVFGEETAAVYLKRRGAAIFLENCVVDCVQIKKYGDKGRLFLQSNRFWEAHSAFNLMSKWLPDHFEHNSATFFCDSSFELDVIKYLTDWGSVLEKSYEFEKALEITDQALAIDSINDTLQHRRYNLLCSLQRPGEAMISVKFYRDSLAAEGFDPIEIDSIIDVLLTGQSCSLD